ncbi:hypothetical protein GCM10008956_18410 [Deinococcus arenae]|uniref:Uncharacterized protein n=1 Tax=Deinococcus arenae TaxID=1452751 RepID=A0A8H9GQN4_9DEIO|nr:hypothetical protein [Deinococcus arenae]AWT36588.1 hypothetical protein DM785_14275 [Deinococcus actinosclerus]GGM42330.1 hypothetical protein GCM10008956_18410 [Deinococcus arenae]
MTWPEDTLRPTAAPTPRKAPNLAVGYLLNVLLPGAGFTYIGLVGWHLGWVGILIVSWMIGGVAAATTASPMGMVIPGLAFVAQLLQFKDAYAARQAQHFRPDLADGVKIGLIAGHAVLNSIAVFGILAAVILPNLLGARERANGAAEQAAAKSAYVQVMVAQVDGTLRDGPCPLENVVGRDRIAICTVTGAATTDPQVAVTFSSGTTITLP